MPETPPPGLTHEQLEFFTEQTRRAVRKSLANYVRAATVGFLILFAGFVYVYKTSTDEAADGRTKIAKIATRADNLANAIQAQRLSNIRTSCEATNTRHDKAVKSLKVLIPANRTGAEREKSLIVIDALADAVAPKQNCDVAVKNAQDPVLYSGFDPKPHG